MRFQEERAARGEAAVDVAVVAAVVAAEAAAAVSKVTAAGKRPHLLSWPPGRSTYLTNAG